MNVLGDRVLELGPTPDASGPYKNFKLTRDADGVAWLLFDREHADELVDRLHAPLLERGEDHLGVAGRAETMAERFELVLAGPLRERRRASMQET